MSIINLHEQRPTSATFRITIVPCDHTDCELNRAGAWPAKGVHLFCWLVSLTRRVVIEAIVDFYHVALLRRRFAHTELNLQLDLEIILVHRLKDFASLHEMVLTF